MPYARPEALVTTEWLARHLDDPKLRVIDGSFKLPGVTPTGHEDYLASHIPGAVYFDIDAVADHASPLPHMLPSAEQFAADMAKLGLGDDDSIIVYDATGLSGAPRVWWMLRVFGHDKVAILDGGLRQWRAEKRPVTAIVPAPPAGHFTAKLNPAMVRSKSQMLENLTSHREQVLDARAKERFEGSAPEPRAGLASGHIPGSLNLPYALLSDPATGTVLPADALADRFRQAGIAPDRPVVTSCGSGVTACVLALGLHLLGRDDVAVYDGSWSEWGLPGDTPLETGPATESANR